MRILKRGLGNGRFRPGAASTTTNALVLLLSYASTALLFPLSAFAIDPFFGFAVGMGNPSSTEGDSGHGIALDSAGNAHVIGEFHGTVDFDPGPGTANLTSVGDNDVFVLKLDSSGNLVWARAMGSSLFDRGFGIAVDDLGSVYTAGAFQTTVDFDPGPGTFNLTSAGMRDVFVQKLDSSGDFVWARAMGGTLDDDAFCIAVDGSGNVYTAGSFEGTADFDPGAGTANLVSAGDEDIFVQKLDSSGDFVWANAAGSTLEDFVSAIALDPSGNVCTTGAFRGTVDFDPGVGAADLTSTAARDIFVWKLGPSGDFVWAKGMGGIFFDDGHGIAVDAAGDVYTTGRFEVSVDFDPGAGTFNLTSEGGHDIFVQKLDSSGNFVWARKMGGGLVDEGRGIAVDASGAVYTTGYFSSSGDFDPGPDDFFLFNTLGVRAFVQKMNSSGNFEWAVAMGQVGAQCIGWDIAVDAARNPYLTGNFSGTGDFDPGPTTFNLTSNGVLDIFVVKLTEPTSLPASTNTALLFLMCVLALASVLGVYAGTRRVTLRRGIDPGP